MGETQKHYAKKPDVTDQLLVTPFVLSFQNWQMQRDRRWARVCQRLEERGSGQRLLVPIRDPFGSPGSVLKLRSTDGYTAL